jgi:hypothetical protein
MRERLRVKVAKPRLWAFLLSHSNDEERNSHVLAR